MKTLTPKTAAAWRTWLSRHHASTTEIWLVFFKQHTGVKALTYQEALDEALCFGWIDGLVRRLDDDRFARRFTPRRSGSRWSDINRKRYAELKAGGRLAAPGVACPPGRLGSAPVPPKVELPAVLPAYFTRGLRAHPKAWRTFEALTASHRRRYFAWVDSAKRDETKQRRLLEAVRLLKAGEKLGLK